jgi:hypothetical protein
MDIESATSKNTESKWEKVSDHPTEAKCSESSKQESLVDHLAETNIQVAEHQEGKVLDSEDVGKISEDDGEEEQRPLSVADTKEEENDRSLSVAVTKEEENDRHLSAPRQK